MIRIRSRRGSQLAEFGPVLYVFLLMILFPLINLLGYACGQATGWLIAQNCVSRAASSIDFTQAMIAVQQECTTMRTSGFGQFAQLQPQQAGTAGINLWVDALDPTTGKVAQTYAMNTPVPPPIDTTKYLYEYGVDLEFKQGPFLNMSGVPFIGSIPGIGQPAMVTFKLEQSAEYPAGVVGSGGAGTGGGTPSNTTNNPPGGGGGTNPPVSPGPPLLNGGGGPTPPSRNF
jgi:hypothetical protein